MEDHVQGSRPGPRRRSRDHASEIINDRDERGSGDWCPSFYGAYGEHGDHYLRVAHEALSLRAKFPETRKCRPEQGASGTWNGSFGEHFWGPLIASIHNSIDWRRIKIILRPSHHGSSSAAGYETPKKQRYTPYRLTRNGDQP